MKKLLFGAFIVTAVAATGREGVFLVPARGVSNPQAQEGPSQGGALQACFVPVTTGIAKGEAVEIVEPGASGSVVTLGNHLLEDGSRITAQEQTTTGGEQKAAPLRPGDGPGATQPGATR